MKRLAGKTALITGGARGMGQDFAGACVREGARVAIAGIDYAKYEGKAPGRKMQELAQAVPYGRMGRAEDLTGMAVFPAPDEAKHVAAQTYIVDGGQWMS